MGATHVQWTDSLVCLSPVLGGQVPASLTPSPHLALHSSLYWQAQPGGWGVNGPGGMSSPLSTSRGPLQLRREGSGKGSLLMYLSLGEGSLIYRPRYLPTGQSPGKTQSAEGSSVSMAQSDRDLFAETSYRWGCLCKRNWAENHLTHFTEALPAQASTSMNKEALKSIFVSLPR